MHLSSPHEVLNDAVRAVLEAVPQQIFVLRPDFTIEFANRALLEYHGEALAAMLFSSNVFERDRALHHPDDLPRVQEKGSYRLPRGLPVELEARLLAGDGTYRWLQVRINPVADAYGKVVCWYGTRTDIDAVKRAEARLREHARETRLLADFMSQLLFTVDMSGRILDANHAALDFWTRCAPACPVTSHPKFVAVIVHEWRQSHENPSVLTVQGAVLQLNCSSARGRRIRSRSLAW